jgi:uncharacterized protein
LAASISPRRAHLGKPPDHAAPPPGLEQLAAAGLFRRPQYPDPHQPVAPNGLHSVCLNVAHTCDLACDYCFAGCGAYGTPSPAVMSPATARAAVDYLMANSPPGRTLSIDFFGGEPMLAWPAVTETVRYGTECAAAQGKTIHFTLTTNAVAMDEQRAAFCAEHMSTLIVSIDGRPETHNRHRLTQGGGPSYDQSVRGARLLASALAERAANNPGTDPHPSLPVGAGPLWVRGTFTADNLDFWRDVEHLCELGFGQVSMEPVTMPPDPRHAIRPDHLDAIRESYEEVVRLVAEGRVKFFHFELNTESPACAPKRFTGCAAGSGYLCVTPAGTIYPCHQFDGIAGFELGSVIAVEAAGSPAALPQGVAAGGGPRIPARSLAASHIGAKPHCIACWAQLHCGGGCHYAAWKSSAGDLNAPYALGCELMKVRLEAALAVQALLRPRQNQGSPGANSGQR